MSLFGGTNYNFYFTGVDEKDREQEIREFIQSVENHAVAVNREVGEFTHDMIFSEAEYIGGEDIKLKCIYARHDRDKIGKTFVAPYENLMTYKNAMQEREFFEIGDIAVGLPSSRGYHVTSIDSLFVGKILLEDDYTSNNDSISTRRWGDIYCTMGVIHSTEGEHGESHRVEMNHFVPTHDPSVYFKNSKDLYSHVGIAEEIPGLIQGIIYPVEFLTMDGAQDLHLQIAGMEQPVIFDYAGMRLFKKGELL